MKKIGIKKISTIILISIALPLLVVNTINNQMSRKLVTDAAVGTISELAPQTAYLAADMMIDMLDDMVNSAAMIGRNPILTDPTVSEEVRTKEILLLKEQIGFIYSDGFSIQNGMMRDGTVVDSAIVEKVRNGGTYITSPTYDAQGNFRFYIYVPIYNAFSIYSEGADYKPQVVGGYRVEYDPIILSEALESCNLGTNGSAYIIDSAGYTIASSEEYGMVTRLENGYEEYLATGENKEMALHEKDMADGKSGVYSYEFDGEEWTSGYAPIGDTGWSIAVELRNDDFTSGVNKAVYTTVLIGAVILVVGILVAFLVARLLSKPIEMVQGCLNEFASGHLPEKIDYKGQTEIGDMVAAVNKLSETLGNVIRDIDSVLGTLAEGDLTAATSDVYVGDFVAIKDSLNQIRDNLSNSFQHIKVASDEVRSGSEQVSSAAQQLAEGSTEQASSIEELSSTINDIYDQVRNNMVNVNDATASCQMVNGSMNESQTHMDDLSNAMQDISNKSSEISKIVKTIEDIAFQTNILALNAAVEAARAGAAGKGFAVVADEVRNLATKSSEAASMTTKLIEDTVQAINQGNELTDKTSNAIHGMIDETNTVIRLVGQISDACEKQESALSQVNIGIDQINSVVQTNSATAEESAAASEELMGQAQTLDRIITHFKLD